MPEHRPRAAHIKKLQERDAARREVPGHPKAAMGGDAALHELPEADGALPLAYGAGIHTIGAWPWNCGLDEE